MKTPNGTKNSNNLTGCERQAKANAHAES